MQHHRPILALSLRLIAAGLLAALLATVKYAAERGISLAEMAFWRQAVTLPMLGGYLLVTGQLAKLRTRRATVHFRRSALGMGIMVCNFLTSILLPLSVATTLGFTTPLFVVILSALFLSERVGPWRWGAVALGFAGVVVIAQPGQAGSVDIPLLGAALGLFTAMMVAIINFQIRDLARTENTISMTFYFALFGTPIAAIFLPWGNMAHDLAGWLLLLAIGVIGTTCQLFIGASLRFAPVSTVIVMDYSAIVWAALYGWMIWDHLPTIATLLGAPLIIAAGIIIAWREHRLAKATSPSSPAALE